MDVRKAYNSWADSYDTNHNRTRDLEAKALQTVLADLSFDSCLEIGCGTGKNTAWLLTKANAITAVDLSEKMLSKAREKITSGKVQFRQADITGSWDFATAPYHLVTFSLVLEHIEDLNDIFRKAAAATRPNGYIYVGELHPFKQYTGTKARFDAADGQHIVTCFNHNVSDFTQAAKASGFGIEDLSEYFDDEDKTNIPRILTLLLRKT